MPPSHPSFPLLPTPRPTFDPYNSSATGHQRADNRLAGSTSWRSSRTLKLSHQFRAGAGGGARISDTVGAGSAAFGRDGRKENGGWERGAPGLRKGERDIREALGGRVGKRRRVEGAAISVKNEKEGLVTETVVAAPETKASRSDASITAFDDPATPPPAPPPPQIFHNTTIYINGSTAPLVGDHMLKHLLVERGANLSIALGRRTVTHVILGRPNGAGGLGHQGGFTRGQGSHGGGGAQKGCGGGLAARKIQKEIARVGGCGVRYVGVEWYVPCIRCTTYFSLSSVRMYRAKRNFAFPSFRDDASLIRMWR